jgi:lysophospholipase L1-like esterase
VNDAGHRGPDFPLEKAPHTYRIAVLGDSVAYGYGVPLRQVFGTLLEERLQRAAAGRRFEVLNFAVSGYGTEAELELYDTKVRRYRPDLVLLAYVLNDVIPPRFLTEMDGAGRRRTERFERISAISQFGAWIFLRGHQLTERGRTRRNYDVFYGDAASWAVVQDSVRGLAERSRRDGFVLAAVVFPLLLDFETYPMREYHERIAAEFEKNAIPHLDLLEAYGREGAEALRLQPRDDSHPNARGHAIAAREIERFLVGSHLIPPPGRRAPTSPGERAGP